MSIRMPDFYVPPLQTPLYWGDEVSGELAVAVRAFYGAMCKPQKTLPPVQLALVRDYCQYVINAPCWDKNPHHNDETRKTLANLRAHIKLVTTPQDLDTWIEACLEEGIDPL